MCTERDNWSIGVRIYGTFVIEVSAQVVLCCIDTAGNLPAGTGWRNSSKVFYRVPAIWQSSCHKV